MARQGHFDAILADKRDHGPFRPVSRDHAAPVGGHEEAAKASVRMTDGEDRSPRTLEPLNRAGSLKLPGSGGSAINPLFSSLGRGRRFLARLCHVAAAGRQEQSSQAKKGRFHRLLIGRCGTAPQGRARLASTRALSMGGEPVEQNVGAEQVVKGPILLVILENTP